MASLATQIFGAGVSAQIPRKCAYGRADVPFRSFPVINPLDLNNAEIACAHSKRMHRQEAKASTPSEGIGDGPFR